MGNWLCSDSPESLPLTNLDEARLLFLAAHICNEAYAGNDDTTPTQLNAALFPEIRLETIRHFRSFETGATDIGNNRAIVFTILLPNTHVIGLGNPSDTEDRRVTVVAVRGTATSTEIQQDIASFAMKSVTQREGDASKGFADAYSSLNGKGLVEYARNLHDETDGRFWVLGHSLGGAVAHLVAIDLKTIAPESQVSLITFGQPRVLSTAFAEDFKDNVKIFYKRMVNVEDPVPSFPSFLRFKHCGVPCLYREDTHGMWYNYTENEDMAQDYDHTNTLLTVDVERHGIVGELGYAGRLAAAVGHLVATQTLK